MKFRITDEFGEVTEVEEIKEETPTEDEEPEVILSKEEIIALKSLIPHIEEIKALFEEEKKEEVEDDEEEKEIVGEEVEEEIHEDDEDIEEEIDEDEDKEEVIDTDEEEEEKIKFMILSELSVNKVLVQMTQHSTLKKILHMLGQIDIMEVINNVDY